MAQVKVLDQGRTNTCYAHTGSVMIDAWLHSHGGDKKKQTNPYVAAMLTNHNFQATTLSNFSCDAIYHIQRMGSCNMNQNSPTKKDEIRVLLNELSQLHINVPMFRGSESVKVQKDYLERTKQEAYELYCKIKGVIPSVVENKELIDLMHITRTLNKSTYIERLTQLMCEKNITRIKPIASCNSDRRVWHGGDAKSRDYKNKLHRLLEKPNAQPIGVGYCGDLLDQGKNFRGYTRGLLGLTSINIKDCGMHESVVIGRKKINGKCHYKIRNSWGTHASYHKDWQNNRDGNVWVDEDTLTHNMGSMSYLE